MRKYSMKKRFLSMMLCVAMALSVVPSIQSQAAITDVGVVTEKTRLAYGNTTGGLSYVPGGLSGNKAFMDAYVYNSNRLNLNSSFKLKDYSNLKNKNGTMPTGSIESKKEGFWYASYKWEPTQAQLNFIKNGTFVVETKLISDYHSHGLGWFKPKTWHWSVIGMRLSRANAEGNNSWTYKTNDYGYRPNGDNIVNEMSAEKNDEQPQKVTLYGLANKINGPVYLNFYQLWDHDCGDARAEGTVVYVIGGTNPRVVGSSSTAGSYQKLVDNAEYSITLNFDTKIRFADNQAHDAKDIYLNLDAEYLPQSGKTGGFSKPIVANLTGMTENSLTFTYKVDADWKHFKITGASSEQPGINQETALKVYDADGEPLDAVSLTSDTLFSDYSGAAMSKFYGYDFPDIMFDGVGPKLNKVDITGSGITTNAAEPSSWKDNSGSNADAAVGEKFTFRTYFSEDVKLENQSNARAVMSITDGSQNPIKLKVSKVSGNCVTFEELTITADMQKSGNRVVIQKFENFNVTDMAGNSLPTGALTGSAIVPAQEIYLDVAPPYIESTETVKPHVISECFSYPVVFYEDKGSGNEKGYSGIDGKSVKFRLEMQDGDKYPYKWYVDTTEAIGKNPDDDGWKIGTTGVDNVIEDISDGTQYWVHIALDKSLNYNYTDDGGMDDNGIYFNGNLVFSGLSDWAGNVGASVTYPITKHQVDMEKPTTEITAGVAMAPDPANYCATFDISVSAKDNYCLKTVSYQWEVAVGDGAFTPVSDFVTISGDVLGTGLVRDVTVDADSYTYRFNPNVEAERYGKVRLKAYCEDRRGLVSDVVTSREISFNFRKAINNSTVEVNGATNAVRIPVYNLEAPTLDEGTVTENNPVSLLIVPDANSKDAGGNYTQFWVIAPSGGVYYDDAFTDYIDWYKSGYGFLNYVDALIYRVNGSVNTATGEADFDEATMVKLNRSYSYYDIADEENATPEQIAESERLKAELMAQQDAFYNYLTQYYGVMELYTVATTSIANCTESLDFAQADSVLDTFRVYVRNATEYSISDVVIRNAAGQTDAQVGDGEVKLDYVGGEGRPAATNLDNVSVSVKVNNVTDPSAMGGVNYGLEYLNYEEGNAAFKLFFTNRTKHNTDYDDMDWWYDPIKTWDLVKSADGINTITFDPGLCTESGWYTLTLEVNDRVTGDKKLEFLGNFFVDNSTLDISMDSIKKSLHLEDEYGRNAFEWTLDEVESKYEAGEDLHMGLAPLPEGWEEGDAYGENLPFISFSTTKRANGINDYAYGVVDNLAKVRIYNQTFNASAELEKDTGLWMDHGSTISAKEYKYHPYLADPAMGAEAYGTADAPQMPMVAGGNLLVYEIMADNGVISKKEIVIYVETELDSKWDLTYEVTYGENHIPINVKVWPISALDGMAMTGLNTGNASYDQTKYNFRLQEGYPDDFVESYDYDEENVENFVYYLIDPYGNISVKTLTATDEEGNVLQIDSMPPEYADQNTRYNNADENHDAAYGLKTDMYRNGDTFHFYIYTYDYDNWIDIQDVYLTFDAEYSKLLGGGEKDEEGRITMQVPVAVDENGEPLKNADGTYTVWESTDPMYNGIYRTQVRQYGPDMTDEYQKDYGGYVAIDVWGTWKYDSKSESPIGTTRTLAASAEDIAGNRLDATSSWAVDREYNPSCVTMGYPLEVGRLAQTDEGVNLIRASESGGADPYAYSVLNDDGTVGFYSTVPFQSISGYGVEEALELDNYHEKYSYYDVYYAPDDSWYGYYAPEGRYYYYNVPMITQDSKVISEDEDGNIEYEPYYFDVVDLFGKSYKLPLYVINQYGELGVDVTFSTILPTNQSVTVYATATGIDEEIESIVAEDGTVGVIDPMDPTAASITVDENCVITIKTKPINPEYEGSVRKVKVSNIDKTLEPAKVLLYDQNYDLLDVSMGATEVTAVLVCEETVFATNGAETYEFPAGSVAGTTYTFEYRDIAGNTGSITATLPIDLSVPDVPEVVVDSESPDVEAGIYAYRKGAYDLLERITNPDLQAETNESKLTAQMSSDENSMFKAQKFRVALNIRDESNYKILVTSVEEEAPTSYEDVESGCTVEHVTMSTGRGSASLEIAENTAFTIHVIDEYNNVNSIENIKIIRVDKTAPELTPEYVASRDEDGYSMITATFHPSEEDKLEDITAITADVPSTLVNVAEEGQDPVYALRYFHVFKENGSFSFTYEDGAGNKDEAYAEVKGMSTDAAAITDTSWFGTLDRDGKHNVTPDKSVNVSRDISVQLRMSKAISQVEMFEYDPDMEDGYGAQLDENSPVKDSVTGSTVVITYTENMDSKVLVRFTASESGRKSTTILPVINCIDKEVPVVTLVGTDVAQDKQSMTFRFETNEKTVFVQNIDEENVRFAKTHEWTTKDDKPMTLYFTDEAGNQAEVKVTDFTGLDLVQLEALYSASSNGSNPTKDPVNDLELFGEETFYVKVNKDAVGSLNNGNEFQITANAWTPITLPDKVGFHILKLVDRNIGKTIQELVCVLPTDNVAPAVELATSTALVYENASMGEMMEAIHQGITVTDNMDIAPTYTVAGVPASAAESGLYTLYYTAKDNKGNESTVQRVLYIMDKDTPILWINDEAGLPYNKVFVKAGKINLTLQNIGEEQPVMIKYSKGLYTTGQMKYNGTIVKDMAFDVTETGHYTIHVRNQDRTEFVTYIYVEG